MKKTLKLMVMTIFVATFYISSLFTSVSQVAAQPQDIEAESAILVDAESGKILYAKNADIALPPASMTKMMTEYLVHEAIDNGDITWETKIEISEYAYSISANNSFSGVGLRLDYEYTVKELYDAMAIYSDNATTIALAELIAGSEGEFVKMMNNKAAEMGLPDAQFVNSSGLPNSSLGDNYPEGTEQDADNLMSARTVATLAYHLISDYPEMLEVSSIPRQEFEGHEMINYNWMLPGLGGNLEQFSYEGMDGIKTGYTDLAGYSFAGTAERNGQRLISVVMRTESESARFNETRKLMDYGFSNFESKELYEEGYQIEEESNIPVAKGKENAVEIASNQSITMMIESGTEEDYSVEYQLDEELLNEDGELTAPIEEGQEVGKMVLNYSGENEYGYIADDMDVSSEVPIVTTSAVEKSNWFVLIFEQIGEFFSNLFASIKGLFT
ncbi:D-alanyl-D-alanine carboxypeptidase [Halalkalibacillus sediminis]|uniref:serine-type D-Ala-D-Ala carboxypeptidase n=1 Tax=Halalkalibacillus sediminis TaxID=2018042 RepID=A0A2I0QSZ9_9BACI|nr:serine hydrolase [Halalkalibacillus sediminis]PKR77446.1 D-alanyl-D-alanine carboxypeptidase [Halalkalibacillus sediminis]